MVYSSLRAIENGNKFSEAIMKALDFLKKEDTKDLPVGRYELDGDNIFVLIQDQTTAPYEQKKPESHVKYIDIQYLFTGEEKQGFAILEDGVKGEQTPGKDNIYYTEVKDEQFVVLKPGDFTIYYPADIHRPNCAVNEPIAIHKAVVKIKMDVL